MEPTTAQKLRNATIQLIVGLLLVGLASWYLTNHPAEWQSIKSSITTARQKVVKLFGSSGTNGSIVSEQKNQAISSMKEIIATIASCDPTAPLDEYQKLYDTISNASLEDFARNGTTYYNQMNAAYQKMQQLCNAIPKTLD